MQSATRSHFLIVLVAGIVIFTNLGAPRLWDEDEPKNAQCAYEMFQAGDWIVPTFNGELRTDKPILLYWFMLVAYHLFGPTEFAARLPSALCGIGTALLTFHLGRRLFNASVGLWAALLLSSSFWFVFASRAATPDGLLIFFSTLALWLYVRGAFPAEGSLAEEKSAAEPHVYAGVPTNLGTFVAMYAAMGMAVLAKGPIGVLLPGSVIGCFILCANSATSTVAQKNESAGWLRSCGTWIARTFWPRKIVEVAWQLRPLTALFIVALIALPWYIAVGLQTNGAWPEGFFLKHNVGRFSAPMEGHSGPPLYHLISIAVCFFPASVFLAPMISNVISKLRGGSKARLGLLFAVSWVAVYVIFFSLAGTKLPSYVTPTYAPLAILTAFFFYTWVTSPEEISRFWQRMALIVFGVVGLVMLIALPWITAKYAPGESWLGAIGVIPLVGAIAALVLSERGHARRAVATFVTFAAVLSTTMFGWAVLRIDRFQNAEPMAAEIEENSSGDPAVVGYCFFRPSWVYYTRQEIDKIGSEEFDLVREHLDSSGDSFLITEAGRLKELESVLPSDIEVLLRRPRFLKDGELVLLGRRAPGQPVRQAAKPTTANR